MIEEWWQAHRFEFIIAGVMIAICAVWLLIIMVIGIIRSKKDARQ